MTESNALKILKNAILMEKKGKAFYQNVAEQAQSPGLKEFFSIMADEEEGHIQMLTEQFKSYKKDNSFKAVGYVSKNTGDVVSEILTKELREEISSAGFESAAISAALSMEEKAIELYSSRAEMARDQEEKKLYNWLAEWEKGHLKILMDMDKELREKIWNDNQFWPF